MNSMVPIAAWAKMSGISRDEALTMVRRGKIPGAKLRKVAANQWFVPAGALPNVTDRRRKDTGQREGPNTRLA